MFHAGQKFGPYTLIRPLGRGSFGEVWLADRGVKFGAPPVAVKLPHGGQVDYAAVEREAQLWRLGSGHTNVLPLVEAHEYDGQVVIVSEYAPDGTLEELIQKNGGALTVRRSVEMTRGILDGLGFLHDRQIIHRDLKSANVMMQCGVPRVTDFGISRQPLKYHGAARFSEGLAGVKINDKWGFIDKTEEVKIKPAYEAVSRFSEGLAGVKVNGKWVFIDRQKNIKITTGFEEVLPFSHDLAGVKFINGGWGFIDFTGAVKLPRGGQIDHAGELSLPYGTHAFTKVQPFSSKGHASVERGGRAFYIDPAGNEVKDP